jgi:hypothetical protein
MNMQETQFLSALEAVENLAATMRELIALRGRVLLLEAKPPKPRTPLSKRKLAGSKRRELESRTRLHQYF